MAADTLDLLTPAEAKSAISLDMSSYAQDEVLERHITDVSRLIDDACGPVVQREVVEIQDGGTSLLFLKEWPVVEIDQIRESSGGVTVILDPVVFGETGEGYTADLRAGTLRRAWGTWLPGFGTVEVTYTAGRFTDTESVDNRFKDAASAILRRLWKREAGAWAQSAQVWEGLDGQAGTGFFRVAAPIIDELLWAEKKPPRVR